MLGRKQSIKQDTILADYGNEELLNESADVEWVNKVTNVLIFIHKIKINELSLNLQLWVRRLMRFCALVSLLSVCLNTPKTFERYPPLKYITLFCDVFVVLLYTAEMITKISVRGFLKGDVRIKNVQI